MAITAANLTSGGLTAGTNTFSTGTITPSSGKFLFINVSARNGASTDPTISSISGCGMTWTAVGNANWDFTSASRRNTHIWKGVGASPSTGAITVTMGQDNLSYAWDVVEIAGADNTTPVVQAGSAVNGDAGTAVTVTLGAFSSTDNATYGAVGEWNGLSLIADTGYSIVTQIGTSDPGLASQINPGNDTSVFFNFGAADNVGAVAVEIKAAAAAAAQNAYKSLLGVGL